MSITYKPDTLHICAQGQYFIHTSDGAWFTIVEGKGVHVQPDQVPEPLFEVTQAYPQKGECWLATNGLTYQVDVSETPTGYARASLRGEVSRDASSVYGLQKAEGKEKDIHLASRIYPDEEVLQETTARYPQEGEVWAGSDGHRYVITRSEYGATRCTAIRVGEQKGHPLTSAHGKDGDKFPTEVILLRCVDKAMPQEMPAPQIGEVWEGSDGNEYTIYFFVDTEPSIPRVFAKDDSVHRATWGNFPMQLPVHLVKRKHLPVAGETPEEEASAPEVGFPQAGEIWETKDGAKVIIRSRDVDELGHVLGSFCEGPARGCLFVFASPSTPPEHQDLSRAFLVRRVSETKERPLDDNDGFLKEQKEKGDVSVGKENLQPDKPQRPKGVEVQLSDLRAGDTVYILREGRWVETSLYADPRVTRASGHPHDIEVSEDIILKERYQGPQLKEGQKWKRRDGKIVTIQNDGRSHGPFFADNYTYATPRYLFDVHPYDLVELLEDVDPVEATTEDNTPRQPEGVSLQVGKRYKTRGGHVVQVVSKGDTWHEDFPFMGYLEYNFSHRAYAADGCTRENRSESSYDLVEELPDADGSALPERNIIVASPSEKARFSSFEDALAYSRTLGGAILQEGQGDDYGYWFVYLVTATLR